MDAAALAGIAERAARSGGDVASERFRTGLSVEEKGPGDHVTAADHAAQEAVVDAIRENSDAPIVAEEVGERDAVPSGRAWIVDPIDGTTNYSRGLPIWACSVAVVEDERAVAAATTMPELGDVVMAGDRTVRNGDPISVSDRADPASVSVCLAAWGAHPHRESLGVGFEVLASEYQKIRRLGSMQTGLAAVATGGVDAVVACHAPYPWDSVGGVHLVRSAGGRVTDWNGDPWRHDSGTLVASNGAVHDHVLDTVSELPEWTDR